ncbi:hypothetical protein Tco_1063124 [Tanacetum coccineum]
MMAGAATINWVSVIQDVKWVWITKGDIKSLANLFTSLNAKLMRHRYKDSSFTRSSGGVTCVMILDYGHVDSGKNNTLWVPQGAMVIKEYSHASSKCFSMKLNEKKKQAKDKQIVSRVTMHSELADIPMVHSHNSPQDKNDKLDLIAELEKLQGSILAFETVKLLWDVNDADLSKVRAFMTAISQIHIKCYVDDAHYDMPLIFYIHGRGLHFGHREFSLITSLHFGEITSLDLIGVIEDEEFFSKICDEDSVPVCLLLSLEVIFMGRKLVHEFDDTLMRLAENLEACNAFPWGEHIWIHLCKQMLNVVSNHKAEHLKGLHMSRNYVPTYTLSGFVWSFKVWILESFERSNCWWSKDSEVIPRGLAWPRKAIFKSTDLSNLFCKESKPTLDLRPTFSEYLTEWWTFNNELLKNYIPRTPTQTPDLFYGYLLKVVSRRQRKKYSRIMTTSIPTVPRSKINMLKDHVITDLNSRIFKHEAIIQV